MLTPISFKYGIPEMGKVTQLRLLLCLTFLEVINMVLYYEFGVYQNQPLTIRTDRVGLNKMIDCY